MSNRADQSERAEAAAWLVIGVVSDGVGAVPPRVVPLTCEECLSIAEAVLSSALPADDAIGLPPTLADRLVSLSARIPALAAWLEPSSAAVAGRDDAPLLARLVAALVLPDADRTAAVARRTPPAAEASVLRAAIRVAESQNQLRDRFDQAVAQARLEAMRELAYGAGHEINNPLANIATRAQALLLDETDPERRRRLSTIVDQSFRARDMIGGLMLLARPPKPRRESVDVGGIAAAAIESVRGQSVARGIRLEYSPLPAPLAVFVDRVQVEEAVRVVVVNALEAVAVGGRVVLEVTRRTAADGGWCEIAGVDDGRGMPLDAVKRAFDPFYSGREAGRGAGLGLPKAWRLVELSGGKVLLDSRPGQGTRVTFLLPESGAVDAEAGTAIR